METWDLKVVIIPFSLGGANYTPGEHGNIDLALIVRSFRTRLFRRLQVRYIK